MIASLLVALIRLYQMTLGRMLGGQCRFYPSCSEYAIAALRSRGAVRGSALAVWRVMRCGPWTAGGIDNPPAPSHAHANAPARARRAHILTRIGPAAGRAQTQPPIRHAAVHARG